MKKYISFLAAAVLCLTSCEALESLLDKDPASKLSPETYFKTATDLQLFTNPLYNNLLPKRPYEEQSDQYTVYTPSDLVKSGTNRFVPPSGGGWTWTDLRRINTCLDYIPLQCEDENAAVQYSALCKFFRVYFYFDKVKRFGDVPWADHELGSTDPILQAPRDSREVVMTHMIEDIDEAIAGLPSSYGSLNYRVTKWAALALKARFCLYEGTFRKYHDVVYPEHDYKYYLKLAYEAADQIMKEGPFHLYSTGNPDLDYAVLFSSYDAQTCESILAINFDYATELMHSATASALEDGRSICITKKFVNSYLMKDGSRFTDQEGWETMQYAEELTGRDPRLAQTIRTPGYSRITENNGAYSYAETKLGINANCAVTGYMGAKFVMPDNNLAYDKLDKSYNDISIFRFGEVLLNFAEAKAEYGDISQDDLDRSINLLRDRAGMPHLDLEAANANPDPYLLRDEFYPDLAGATNAGVILEIRRERAVELAQEGFRYGDLMRWKHGEHLAEPYYGIYIPGPGVYDLDGDGINDFEFYTEAASGATVTKKCKLGSDIYLSEGDHGYLDPHHAIDFSFDPVRDYFYPIPINDRTLNHNLTQNPGWDDGLSF